MYRNLTKAQKKDVYSYLPEHLQEKLSKVLEEPGCPVRECGVCGDGFVGRGAEWIEWWEFVWWPGVIGSTATPLIGDVVDAPVAVPAIADETTGDAEETTGAAEDTPEDGITWMTTRAADFFLSEEFNTAKEDSSEEDLADIEKRRSIKELVEEMGPLGNFYKRFLLRRRNMNGTQGASGSVLPMLRVACSGECAEAWLKGRVKAEKDCV